MYTPPTRRIDKQECKHEALIRTFPSFDTTELSLHTRVWRRSSLHLTSAIHQMTRSSLHLYIHDSSDYEKFITSAIHQITRSSLHPRYIRVREVHYIYDTSDDTFRSYIRAINNHEIISEQNIVTTYA